MLWLGGRFFSLLFSDVRSEAASAEIQIIKGRAEFSFPESEQWTPAYSEQKFLAGDSIRTGTNSRVSLEFLGGNMIFLDENSEVTFAELEEKSSGKKIVSLRLDQGRLWARVSDDDFNSDSDSHFTVASDRVRVYVRGTLFDLTTNSNQDVIRLIKGNVDVDVLDNEAEVLSNVPVGVGQKLVVSSTTLPQLQANQDVLEIIDTDFIESEWHLQNLERFFPQEAGQIRRRIEISAPKASSTTETPVQEAASTDLDPVQITSPADGAVIPASQDTVTIEGIAPLQAAQISVNGYTLTRYQPGDRRWTYFASKKFGTLLPGENKYSVVAVTRDGKRSPAAEISITYQGAGAPVNTDSEPTIESSIDEFKAPVVTNPPTIDANQPYQTSSDVVTIRGIVDPKTNMVEVNGFRLQQFRPGQTEFKYLANARYGNMKEGENIYAIVATGPDGKTATTEIKIVYTPLNLGN